MKINHKIIFHVDMDAFFASCEEAINPSLRSKPLVVGGLRTDVRSIVMCPNYLARAKGVRTAMPLSKALGLVPEANFIRSTRGLYSDYSKRVKKILKSYTPLVQPMSIDEAFLDVTGVLHDYNYEYVELANAIKEEIKKTLDITCSIGISTSKVCSKIASKVKKPDGVTLIPFGGEKEFLGNMPIESIPGVGKSTQARLKRYGINLIRDILKFDKSFYENEIGIHSSFLMNVASGKGSDTIHEEGEERKSLSKENTFYEDTLDRDFLMSEMYYMMEKCCQKLRKDKMKARTITIKIKYFDFKVNQKSFTGHRYSNIESDFYNDAAELLDKILTRKKKIRLLGVKFSEFIKGDDSIQENLFQESDKRENLMKKIDKIRKKYDFDAVKFGRTI